MRHAAEALEAAVVLLMIRKEQVLLVMEALVHRLFLLVL
jgi:hypothetical protein